MRQALGVSRWVIVAAFVAATVVVLGPAAAVRSSTDQAIWTEHTITVAPGTMVQVPAWPALVRTARPAVVNISTRRVERGPAAGPMDGFFGPLFGEAPPRTTQSLGSGFIINPNGFIVTNDHVVDGAAQITVKLADGRELPARVAGRDDKTDLALLRIDATGLPVIPLGDSSTLEVGEPVMSIGNPFGLEQTVTTGIVSATGRVIGAGPYDDFIQTDASINPGNSGGPLLNARGQAIGINTAIVSGSGGSVGIGFAIPTSLAKPIIAQLAASGRVTRGWLGIEIQPVTPALARSFGLPDATGALVTAVADGSPAMTAGLARGDVIVEIDREKVAGADRLPSIVAGVPVGREVPITVFRDGKPLTLHARIGQLAEEEPEERAAAVTPSLGMALATLTPERARALDLTDSTGVFVLGVKDGSPASEADIQPGDVIVEIDHHPVATVEDLRAGLDRHDAAQPLLMLVRRDRRTHYVAIAS